MSVLSSDNVRQLYATHHDELSRYAIRLTGSSDVAADLLQECFLRVLGSERFAAAENQRAYLFAVISNLARDYWKQQADCDVKSESDAAEPIAADTPVRDLLSQEQLAALQRALCRLPPRQRQAFVLRRVDGLSVKEVGREMGLAPGTVEKHLTLALRRIDECLNWAGMKTS